MPAKIAESTLATPQLSASQRDALLDRPIADLTASAEALASLQDAGYLDDEFKITESGAAVRRQLLNEPGNRAVSLYRVSGPWRRPADTHPSFDIHGPDSVVAAVFAIDDDFAGAERRAKIMAAALDADARDGK